AAARRGAAVRGARGRAVSVVPVAGGRPRCGRAAARPARIDRVSSRSALLCRSRRGARASAVLHVTAAGNGSAGCPDARGAHRGVSPPPGVHTVPHADRVTHHARLSVSRGGRRGTAEGTGTG